MFENWKIRVVEKSRKSGSFPFASELPNYWLNRSPLGAHGWMFPFLFDMSISTALESSTIWARQWQRSDDVEEGPHIPRSLRSF